jgi:hypothetical protein
MLGLSPRRALDRLVRDLPAMDKLLFWLGLGAAQKAAGSTPTERRNWVVSLVVGILVAAVMIVGMFLLLVSQKI